MKSQQACTLVTVVISARIFLQLPVTTIKWSLVTKNTWFLSSKKCRKIAIWNIFLRNLSSGYKYFIFGLFVIKTVKICPFTLLCLKFENHRMDYYEILIFWNFTKTWYIAVLVETGQYMTLYMTILNNNSASVLINY